MEKQVVMYARTSSQASGGTDKDSLKRQRHSVSKYCKSNGLIVVKEFYDKGVSGTTDILSRSSFIQMMNYCKNNSIETIVVESSDRLARDLIIMETAFMYLTSKCGYNLVSVANPETFVAKTPTATLIRQILGVISQFDKSQVVEKLSGARKRKKVLNKSRGITSRNGNGKVEGRKFLTEKHPQLFELVVKYRKNEGRTKPLSYMGISKKLKAENDISISYNTVNRILRDVERIKRENRNTRRRKKVA